MQQLPIWRFALLLVTAFFLAAPVFASEVCEGDMAPRPPTAFLNLLNEYKGIARDLDGRDVNRKALLGRALTVEFLDALRQFTQDFDRPSAAETLRDQMDSLAKRADRASHLANLDPSVRSVFEFLTYTADSIRDRRASDNLGKLRDIQDALKPTFPEPGGLYRAAKATLRHGDASESFGLSLAQLLARFYRTATKSLS